MTELTQNHIERTIAKRQLFHIPFSPVDLHSRNSGVFTCLLQKFGREVEAARLSAQSGCGNRYHARAACYVKNSLIGLHACKLHKSRGGGGSEHREWGEVRPPLLLRSLKCL